MHIYMLVIRLPSQRRVDLVEVGEMHYDGNGAEQGDAEHTMGLTDLLPQDVGDTFKRFAPK